MAIKIGILGSGSVGVTLANGFERHGYDVMIGTNTPAKHEGLREKTGGAVKVGTFAETAKHGSILVLAVKGDAAEAVLRSAGLENLAGKTILDTTNPIAASAPVNGVIRYFTSPNESLMERLQNFVPEARFVKCFSCVGAASMVNPDFGGEKPTMFICGNNESAKQEVRSILDIFGWEYDDMGKAEGARAVEPLAMLWCIPGFLQNRWTHALRMLRK